MLRYFLRPVLAAAIAVFLLTGFHKSTCDQNAGLSVPQADRISLLFAGDIMQHQGQIDAAWNDSLKTYVYDSCFKYVASLIRSADVAMANFEFTLGGKPYTGYPQFSAPDQIVQALIYAGFDIMNTTNNHSCDRGKKGIERTIRILDSCGMPHVGTYRNQAERDASYPFFIKKNNFKIALLSYSYGTNGIPVPAPNIVNLIDKEQMKKDLKQAKDSMPDAVIAFMHWGDEYKSLPNDYQKDIAAFLYENGADYVIGMHPHVLQPMERFYYPDSSGREVLITWSLGNYVSNQRDRYKDGGAMIRLDLVKENGKVSIESAGYFLSWVYVPVVNGKKSYYILPVSLVEQGLITTDAEARVKLDLFASDARSLTAKHNKGIREYVYDAVEAAWKIRTE